jgi:hypothetical protein
VKPGQAALGAVVVFPLDPGGQAAIERGEAGGILRRQTGEELGAHGSEEALDFALALGPVRAGLDQGDTELGAHQGQVLGAVIGPVVHIQALRQSAAQDGLAEHRQEGLGVLRQGKGGRGDDPGGIVDEGDQVGLTPGAITHRNARPVHDIAHPQLPGLGEGEAAPVAIARILLGPDHQAMAGEQPMHGGGRQRQVRGHLGGLARRCG